VRELGREDALAGSADDTLFRLLVESSRDHAMLTLDPDGYVTSWNIGARVIKGYAAHEIIGKHFSQFYPAQSVLRGVPAAELVIALREGRLEDENWRVRKDGTQFWANVVITALIDEEGRHLGFSKVTRDLTKRRRREEALRASYARIKSLAQRLETVREDERRSVAHTLHEGIAQDLFAAALTIGHFRARLAHDEEMNAACDELGILMERCLTHTRQVANDLRPSQLGHLPLPIILKGHARHIAELSDLRIDVSESAEFPELKEGARLLFFRAAQEALTNVIRHARAKCVGLVLRADSVRISMEVTDDGIGIADGALDKAGSLGLLGIRERLGTLGGGLIVERAAAGGTRMIVHVPRHSSAFAAANSL
jgi:PAS domain S-box-containing protein